MKDFNIDNDSFLTIVGCLNFCKGARHAFLDKDENIQSVLSVVISYLEKIVEKHEKKEITEEINLNISVYKLDFKNATANVLEKNNIKTLEALMSMSEHDLKQEPGLGSVALEDIVSTLANKGLKLKRR